MSPTEDTDNESKTVILSQDERGSPIKRIFKKIQNFGKAKIQTYKENEEIENLKKELEKCTSRPKKIQIQGKLNHSLEIQRKTKSLLRNPFGSEYCQSIINMKEGARKESSDESASDSSSPLCSDAEMDKFYRTNKKNIQKTSLPSDMTPTITFKESKIEQHHELDDTLEDNLQHPTYSEVKKRYIKDQEKLVTRSLYDRVKSRDRTPTKKNEETQNKNETTPNKNRTQNETPKKGPVKEVWITPKKGSIKDNTNQEEQGSNIGDEPNSTNPILTTRRNPLRRTIKEMDLEKMTQLDKILSIPDNERNLEVFQAGKKKGRGVRATQQFSKNSVITEYKGKILEDKEGKEKYKKYTELDGSFLLSFKFEGKKYWCDATPETEDLGRLINHGIKDANTKVKPMRINGKIRLVIEAIKQIEPNEELLYDYGERDPEVLKSNPWLKGKKESDEPNSTNSSEEDKAEVDRRIKEISQSNDDDEFGKLLDDINTTDLSIHERIKLSQRTPKNTPQEGSVSGSNIGDEPNSTIESEIEKTRNWLTSGPNECPNDPIAAEIATFVEEFKKKEHSFIQNHGNECYATNVLRILLTNVDFRMEISQNIHNSLANLLANLHINENQENDLKDLSSYLDKSFENSAAHHDAAEFAALLLSKMQLPKDMFEVQRYVTVSCANPNCKYEIAQDDPKLGK